MTKTVTQFEQSIIDDRLFERFTSLGITLASITRNAECFSLRPVGPPRWIESLLFTSPVFIQQIGQAWDEITTKPGEAVQVWPGVWIVVFAGDRRRTGIASATELHNQDKADSAEGELWQGHIVAGLLLSEAFATSEQLMQVCQSQQIDHQVTVGRINKSPLFNENEVDRIAPMLAWMSQDTRERTRRRNELNGLSEELSESYEELSLLYQLSSSMAVDQPPASFLINACKELQQVVGLRWLSMKLIEDNPRLNELSGQQFNAGSLGEGVDTDVIGQYLLQAPMDHMDPSIIDDLSGTDIPDSSGKVKDLLIVPLTEDDRLLGVLYGGAKVDCTTLTTVDTKLCCALANTMSIFIQNTMLYEDVQAMFMGALKALTSAIDAKDSYTFGHSERVALMSRQLAHAAGLLPSVVERVHIAGLVHDVGKIGVSEAVLCKPGRLSLQEFEEIKKHPEIGAHILRDIRQMDDLIPGVLYHHERWDGKGYPHQLSGEEVPIFGRIIALADAFDAMSSNRTYRAKLSHDEVLAEIEQCAGTQFDPDLAAIFIKLDFKPFFDLIEQHTQLSVHTDNEGADAA